MRDITQALIEKAKSELNFGDIKTISDNSKIPYQTVYKVLNGERTTRQTEILKAVTNFLQERKTELERLQTVLN